MTKCNETLSRYLKSGLDKKEDREMARLTGLSLKAFKKTRGSRTIDKGVVQVLKEKGSAMKREEKRWHEEHKEKRRHEKKEHARKSHKRGEKKHEGKEMHRELMEHHMKEAHKHMRKMKHK